jgi:hypothetical protein
LAHFVGRAIAIAQTTDARAIGQVTPALWQRTISIALALTSVLAAVLFASLKGATIAIDFALPCTTAFRIAELVGFSDTIAIVLALDTRIVFADAIVTYLAGFAIRNAHALDRRVALTRALLAHHPRTTILVGSTAGLTRPRSDIASRCGCTAIGISFALKRRLGDARLLVTDLPIQAVIVALTKTFLWTTAHHHAQANDETKRS